MKPVEILSDDEFVLLTQRAVALPDAPAELIQAAIGLWPWRIATPLEDAARAGLRLVAAVLSFDSWARPQLALGMRGTVADTRHLLFSAMGRDIDLRIIPLAEHFALAGQILGPDETGIVELVTATEPGDAGNGAQVASLDAMGEFRLESVRGGTYHMTLRMGGDKILLPPIEIGERSA